MNFFKNISEATKRCLDLALVALIATAIALGIPAASAQVLRPSGGSLLTPSFFSKTGSTLYTTSASDTLGDSGSHRLQAVYAYVGDFSSMSISGATAGDLDVNGHITDADGALKSPYTFVVAASGGDYTSVSTAVAACPSAGCLVLVTTGTYTETSKILIGRSNTFIQLMPDSVIQNNGGNVSPIISASTTGLSRVTIRGGKLLQTAGTAQGTAIDLSNISNAWASEMRVENYNLAVKYTDTANTTFYNSIRDMQLFDNNNCIEYSGSQPNSNVIINVRCRPKAGGGGTGLKIVDTRGLTVMASDWEPAAGSAAGITGISIDGTSREILLQNNWIEGNETGLSIASGATRVTVTGGSITSNTTNLSDDGTDTVFLNTSNAPLVGTVFTMNYGVVKRSWIKPFHWSPSTTSQTFTAGTAICEEFEMIADQKIDTGSYTTGGVVAGNVKIAFYGPTVTEDTIASAPLLVQSATTSVTASINSQQTVSVTPTYARRGRYYKCIVADDSSNTFQRNANQTIVAGWGQTKAGVASVAAGFPDTITSPTNTGSALPVMTIRLTP